MGFFSDLFSCDTCRNCGSTRLKLVVQYGPCELKACYNCSKVHIYDKVPICAVCNRVMREAQHTIIMGLLCLHVLIADIFMTLMRKVG